MAVEMYEKQRNSRRKGRDLSLEISLYKSETLPLKASGRQRRVALEIRTSISRKLSPISGALS